MAAIKLPVLSTGLGVDRTLTAAKRRCLLAAAGLLLAIGGHSTDRKHYQGIDRAPPCEAAFEAAIRVLHRRAVNRSYPS